MSFWNSLAQSAGDLGSAAIEIGAVLKSSIVVATTWLRSFLKADTTWSDRTKTGVCGIVGVFVIAPGMTEYLELGPRAAGAVMFMVGMGARPALEWMLRFLQLCRDDPGYVLRTIGLARGKGKD